jgi:hypothetical protein
MPLGHGCFKFARLLGLIFPFGIATPCVHFGGYLGGGTDQGLNGHPV